MTNKTSLIVFGLILFAASFVKAQTVPYALLTPPRSCFTDSNGYPLAGGFLYSYSAGTSNQLATYHIDTLGHISANQNPIILPSTGCAEVRLQPLVYKFTLQDSTHTQIWQIDQVQDVGQIFFGQAVLLNPVAQALQTIAGPLAVNAITVGGGTSLATSNQSGTGSLCLTSNCALLTPSMNGTTVVNEPGTYTQVTNSASPGTAVNTLTKVVVAGSGLVGSMTSGSETGGVFGVCILNCGTAASPNATVQQNGVVNCLFDGATTAGDYVQIGAAGDCHDAGAAYPTFGGQILGRVGATALTAGLYPLNLFGPEIQPGSSLVYTSNGVTTALLNNAHTVLGGVTLASGSASFNIAGPGAFGSSSSCVGTDSTAANPVQVKNFGGSANALTITGTGSDNVTIVCVGH